MLRVHLPYPQFAPPPLSPCLPSPRFSSCNAPCAPFRVLDFFPRFFPVFSASSSSLPSAPVFPLPFCSVFSSRFPLLLAFRIRSRFLFPVPFYLCIRLSFLIPPALPPARRLPLPPALRLVRLAPHPQRVALLHEVHPASCAPGVRSLLVQSDWKELHQFRPASPLSRANVIAISIPIAIIFSPNRVYRTLSSRSFHLYFLLPSPPGLVKMGASLLLSSPPLSPTMYHQELPTFRGGGHGGDGEGRSTLLPATIPNPPPPYLSHLAVGRTIPGEQNIISFLSSSLSHPASLASPSLQDEVEEGKDVQISSTVSKSRASGGAAGGDGRSGQEEWGEGEVDSITGGRGRASDGAAGGHRRSGEEEWRGEEVATLLGSSY
ncbi:unnamed protein product [Closterium sp. NIES-65]|nr:unnamed protein product [Closterium sp. NIES-65]